MLSPLVVTVSSSSKNMVNNIVDRNWRPGVDRSAGQMTSKLCLKPFWEPQMHLGELKAFPLRACCARYLWRTDEKREEFLFRNTE